MTNAGDIRNFVKSQGRISTTDRDAGLLLQINEAYLRLVRKAFWPALRKTGTISLVAGTQDYALAADFDRLIEDSIRYDSTSSWPQALRVISSSDAELWELYQTAAAPAAVRVIAGASGAARKLRVLPPFTETGRTLAYAYQARPAALTVDASIPEVLELAEAVAWEVLMMNADFERDKNGNRMAFYKKNAKEAWNSAYSTTLQ